MDEPFIKLSKNYYPAKCTCKFAIV